MSDMLEVLFTCDDNEHQLTCSAWDFRTGSNLMTYKGGGCAQQRSLCFFRSHYMILANSTKPLIHVWPINSQEQISSVRFVAPGKPNTLALSPDGNYLVAGIQETIFIWHMTTARMLNSISKHYQKVNCIKFTHDSSHFVSAGQDGGVMVWNLTQLVTRSDDNQTPLYTFNDHGLPVTDVHIGAGGIRAYMATVSLDRTCKIYDLSCGTLLLSVVFPEGLKCVVMNALETCVYVGTIEGGIYEFRIDSLPRTKEYHMEEEVGYKFAGHKEAVLCLALSLDGQTLVSGGQDSKVCVWHISSRQLIRSLPHKGAVSNVALRLTCSAIFNPEQKQPQMFVNNLKRMIDPPEADEEEIIEVLVEPDSTNEVEQGFVSGTRLPCNSKAPDLTINSSDSIEEIQKLQQEVQKLRHLNKKLFNVSVRKLLRKK